MDRLKKVISNIPFVGTLHGLAYRVLQKYDQINYTILDEKEATKSIRSILEDTVKKLDVRDEVFIRLHSIIPHIYDLVSMNYPPNLKLILRKKKLEPHYEIVKNTLISYDKYKMSNKYLDFNDLMVKFVRFLKKEESVEFKNRIKYILFDEYQDINGIQNTILNLLNEKCKNLTVVGDDSQSIYAFRGSEIKYIMNFEKSYNNVKVINLEKNYRSTPQIINFCNDIIKNNNGQLKKNMINAIDKIGLKPKITGFRTTQEEIKYIIGRVKENNKMGTKFKSQVIIARKNSQLNMFEMELIRNKINYIKTKGVGILDRVHVKDFLAFLIVLVNNNSLIHWKRILAIVPGVGNKTILKIFNANKSVLKVIKNPQKYISNVRICNLLKVISNVINKIFALYNSNTKDRIKLLCVNIIAYLSPHIKKNMRDNERTSAEEKIEDLFTLQTYISKTEDIQTFLADMHLSINIDHKKEFEDNENDDYLLLSTIHGAKGLEWEWGIYDRVFF